MPTILPRGRSASLHRNRPARCLSVRGRRIRSECLAGRPGRQSLRKGACRTSTIPQWLLPVRGARPCGAAAALRSAGVFLIRRARSAPSLPSIEPAFSISPSDLIEMPPTACCTSRSQTGHKAGPAIGFGGCRRRGICGGQYVEMTAHGRMAEKHGRPLREDEKNRNVPEVPEKVPRISLIDLLNKSKRIYPCFGGLVRIKPVSFHTLERNSSRRHEFSPRAAPCRNYPPEGKV